MSATPPERPHPCGPLHNFSLPQLTWSKNQSINLHRSRRLGQSSSHQSTPLNATNSTNLPSQLSVSAQRPSSSPFLASKPESANAGSSLAAESPKKALFSYPSDRIVEKSRKKAPEGNSSETKHVIEKSHTSSHVGFEEEVEEKEQRNWNLRPRKLQRKPRCSSHGACKVDGATLHGHRSPLPPVSRGSGKDKGSPKTSKKPMFSLSISREEMEEDIFSMTGSRMSRNPKKRPKAVQKQLDVRNLYLHSKSSFDKKNLFPGMSLASVSPDACKVHDASQRRRKK